MSSTAACQCPAKPAKDKENEARLAAATILPELPTFPKMNKTELYSAQQALKPIACEILFRASARSLNDKEQELFAKAKTEKLPESDMIELRVMAGNGQPSEEIDVVHEDVTIDEDEEGDSTDYQDEKTPLPLITQMITDLGANAAGASVILASIREHAQSIYIDPQPLYHTKTSKHSSVPGDVQLGLLITSNNPVGASHEEQLSKHTHVVVVGVIHGRNPPLRALLVWDVNVLHTDLPKSKVSLHDFWINEGQQTNHPNICLSQCLEQILHMAQKGLDIKWGDTGELVSVGGFQQVEDADAR
ncbi:hypothetical protein B0H19DRAFT_1261392 [Mycena capillaripes]|nr:hypothetical protein B0H19DRAFT_1261392 [Mycena capillaripes]